MAWEHLLAAVRALDSVPGRAQATAEVSALDWALGLAQARAQTTFEMSALEWGLETAAGWAAVSGRSSEAMKELGSVRVRVAK